LTSKEVVDLVDLEDAVVGSATVRECLERGLLHRAVAVLVIRSNGKFVLQQRSHDDLWHPGLWTISSTGHVKKGERYDAAALRELGEELGIVAPLAFKEKFKMPPLADRGLTELEWVSFFTCSTDDPFTVDPVELEGAKDFSEGELREMIKGGTLTPDAKIILAVYLDRWSH
jgi:isopentenyl-diphosphate Delta-isomerase